MASSCPECGESTEFRTHTVDVLEGTCSKGHRTVLLGAAADLGEAGVAGASARAPTPCWDCGAELRLTIEPGRRVRAECAACGRTTLLLEGDGAEPSGAPVPGRAADNEEDDDDEDDESEDEDDDRRPRPRRPPFRPPAPGGRRPMGGFGPRPDRPFRPAARPCRQCGGVLSFEENQDGSITGRCASCGNTFSMRPRASGDRGDRPQYNNRRPGWGGRPSAPRYSSGPPKRWRRDSESDDPRRRRRRDD